MKLPESEIKNQKTKILAFGFDKLGFDTSHGVSENDYFTIHFFNYDSKVNVDGYEGIIIPSGIFEKRSEYSDLFEFHGDKIAEFERLIYNHNQKKRWVAFLMSDIVINLMDNYRNIPVGHTDLAKKMLLSIFTSSRPLTHPRPYLTHRKNEFQKYVESFGVGKTEIRTHEEIDHTPLVVHADEVFGTELNKKLFFLPCHTTNKDKGTLVDLCSLVSDSIIKYRSNHSVNVPDWVRTFEFSSEVQLRSDLEQLNQKMAALESQINVLDDYKSVLALTGSPLVSVVSNILKDFWGLKLDEIDDRLDDLSIRNDLGEVLVSIEVKGVEGDIKRKYLSQLNSNRDMKDYPVGTTGLLLINDCMKLRSVEEKGKTLVSKDVLDYALKEKIFVLRTIDLLLLMNMNSSKEIDARRKIFMDLLSGNGGWVTVRNGTVKVET